MERKVNICTGVMARPFLPSDLTTAFGARAPTRRRSSGGHFSLGFSALDGHLNGGLERGAIHEIYAAGVEDCVNAAGFAGILASRAGEGRPLCWIRQEFADRETGAIYPPGLAELGFGPERFLLVRVRDGASVLRAGAEAARCSSLGAVVIAPWGAPKEFDLTASRRLKLLAEASGVPLLMLRVGATPYPSAAQTRWRVGAAPSRAQPARAPGFPAFQISLLRHRGGIAPGQWCVEWNRDRYCFEAGPEFQPEAGASPLSGAVVPFPADRPDPAERNRRQAG
jgi:protein ImuA